MKTKLAQPFYLPSALTQLQHNWQHWDGICHVDDAPSGDTPPVETSTPPDDYTELKSAIQKEREQRAQYEKELKTLKKQLEVFNGIDPEKARQAEQILKEVEERSQWESRIKAETEAQLQPKLTEYQKLLQEKEAALLSYRRDTALEKAFYASGGIEGEFEAIAHGMQKRVQVDNAGNIKVLDEKGQQMYVKGEPATIGDLITDMKEKVTWFARHFRDTSKPGFGVNGTGTSVPSAQMEGMSPWEKVELARKLKGRA